MFNYISILVLVSIKALQAQIVKEPLIIEDRWQTYKVTLNNQSPFIFEKESRRIISFDGVSLEEDPGKPALPMKTLFIALPPNADVSINLANQIYTSYENVEPEVSKKIKLNKDVLEYEDVNINPNYLYNDVYPEKEFEIIGYTFIRDYYCAIVNIYTHRFFWKKRKVDELISFELQIKFDNYNFVPYSKLESNYDKYLKDVIFNFEHAQQFKVAATSFSVNDTTGNWIDYSKTYLKFGIPRDGVYRITYNNLLNYGINPSSINPNTFKIFNKGSQIPIRVKGEDDLSFDPNDFIEFYATKNYDSTGYRTIVSLGQDYKNFMNRYTDTNFVFLTWDGSNGLRYITFNGTQLNSNDSLNAHKAFIHLENDIRLWYYDNVVARVNLPQWQENKVWTWQVLGRGSSLNLSFNASNIVPNSTLRSYVRIISYASNITTNAHKIGIAFNNNTILDSVTFNFKQTANLFSTLNSNVLNNGSNQLRLFGMPTSASFYQVLIDWADIEYLRYNHLTNDSLFLLVDDNVQPSVRAVKIFNSTGSINDFLIYKIGDRPKFIDTFHLAGGQIVFFDSVKSRDRYIILKQNKVLTPVYYYTKQFVNLRSTQNAADYIIISNKDLAGSVNTYKSFIDQNYNIRTKVVFVDDIFDEFGFGNPEAEAIKRFLKKAYDSWQSPSPSSVFLIGDANYDYKDVWTDLSVRRKNFVPSYGQPVSDAWFVIWDSQNPLFPQMSIGRLPARNNSEVLHYLSKHQSYLNKDFDDWNKRFLVFSGGDPTKLSELLEIRNKHQQLFDNVLLAVPVGGTGRHFYKTVNPNSNFGPFPSSVVQNAIDSGGVFISYIGHSGTQTWDNGIVNVNDLKNIYPNRKPLITDFGCSTGRFAEPDIECFGEIFVTGSNNGQAISYVSNSSFGYLSTSLRFPEYFYSQLLLDTVKEFGAVHNLAKIKQIILTGSGDVNKVFTYCNVLFGDPIIKFKVPSKPNLFIKSNLVQIQNPFPNDSEDSLLINFDFYNYGIVSSDSFSISIKDFFKDTVNYSSISRISLPRFNKNIAFKVPIKNKPGNHRLEIFLDFLNEITEINENDNFISINYNVFSTSLLPVEKEKFYPPNKDSVLIINPSFRITENYESLILQIADNPEFNNPVEITKNFDTLYSVIQIPQLTPAPRYYWRVKVNSPNSQWSEIYSFSSAEENFDWFVDSTFRQTDIEFRNTFYNQNTKSFELDNVSNSLKIQSAGATAGKFATMYYNGQQVLPNSFFWGIVTALIDTVTYQPYNFRYYLFPTPPSGDSLKAYIDNLPTGTVIALAVSDDAAQSVLGFSSGTPVRNSIKTLGSIYIDSVMYRESWCIIGKKGAQPGTVPEAYRKRFEGIAELEFNKSILSDSGKIVFPVISNSTFWNKLKRNILQPDGSNIQFKPLGIKENGVVDTLNNVVFVGDSASISYINPNLYSAIKLQANLSRNNLFQSPSIKSLGVKYKGLPEIAINYQTVSINKDSVDYNDSVKLSFNVMNLGESKADSLRIKIKVSRTDYTERTLFDTLIFSLDALEKFSHFYVYKNDTTDGTGLLNFKIIADPDNQIKEFSELNNLYSIPFYARPDTVTTSILKANLTKVLFDDNIVYSGDYTSKNPKVMIEIKYGSRFPFDDSTAIRFYLNNILIPYSSLLIINDSATRTMSIHFKPTLSDGEHQFKIIGEDLINKVNNDEKYELLFYVSSEIAIIDLYNYPNPFSDETYFTFRLPEIPDELRIKIYTIAGRFIKELIVNSEQLKNSFNVIHWDGKDADGNEVANGVYIYKAIIRKGEKVFSTNQKLSILK